jgi:hypothetical protein
MALLAAQSRVRAVVRQVVWRDFGAVASPELIERVCQAVFRELHLCCSDCAKPEPNTGCGCR